MVFFLVCICNREFLLTEKKKIGKEVGKNFPLGVGVGGETEAGQRSTPAVAANNANVQTTNPPYLRMVRAPTDHPLFFLVARFLHPNQWSRNPT